jgi:undecaprenyl-diphosphatase
MQLIHAIVLGIVEGLTEFVPVSSTGHLILAGSWLGLDADPARKAAVDAFDIVIQAGAVLACLVWYFPLLRARAAELQAKDDTTRLRARNLLYSMVVAFVPVMIVGLAARKTIKAALFGPAPVAWALAIGGVVMIATDLAFRKRPRTQTLDDMGPLSGLKIGLIQCFSLIPGTSRSMSTMIGAMLSGFDTKAAADFSFLLAIPVLGAATGYELLKEWPVLARDIGPAAMAVGLATSFLFGWLSIAGFLKLIAKVGLLPFGLYRIGLAAVVWFSLLR